MERSNPAKSLYLRATHQLSSMQGDAQLTSTGIGQLRLCYDPIAISTAVPNEVQTSTGRKDLPISQWFAVDLR
jgi:hypothetical protein